MATEFKRGGIVFLNGTLGAGKTTLSKGILKGLGHDGSVKSPTYSLLEIYELPELTIYHFDLYRLSDPEELEFIGGREYFDECVKQHCLCLVEWPEKAYSWLPQPQWTINLAVNTQGRDATIESFN